jgi:hypothetical protein
MTASNAVYFRGSRYAARQLAYRFVGMLTGREADSQGLARGVFATLGYAALSDIKDDFVRKARGGTGEDGVTWPKLSPKTIAYGRRFGPGEKSRLKRAAGLGRANSKAPGGRPGLLTAAQLKQWKAIYRSVLARLMVTMGAGAAKAQAARIAWAKLKKAGAKTMLEVYGSRQVDILRDTGVLLNSLSPGELGGAAGSITSSPPSADGGEAQVFKLFESGVIVGTTVPYARDHQEGDPARNLPPRPFLPTHGIPPAWLANWEEAGGLAIAAAARRLFEAAA